MQDPLENACLDATRMPLALGKASELGLFPQGSLDRTTATRHKAVTAVTKLDIPDSSPAVVTVPFPGGERATRLSQDRNQPSLEIPTILLPQPLSLGNAEV